MWSVECFRVLLSYCCVFVLNHVCRSPSEWLSLCPCAKGHWHRSGAQPLCWVSPWESHPKSSLNLCKSVKLFSIWVLRLVGGCLLLYSRKKRMRSLSPSWRVQVQIPRPDWSLDTYSILFFLEAGQLLSLLFHILWYVFFSCCGGSQKQLKLDIKMLIDLSY